MYMEESFDPLLLQFHRCDWDADKLISDTSMWLSIFPAVNNNSFSSICNGLTDSLDRAAYAVKYGPGLFLLKDVPVASMSMIELQKFIQLVGKRFGVLSPMDSSGKLVHMVQMDLAGKNFTNLRGYQSNGELALHNDGCDVIAFLCVRPADNGGERRVASAVRILRSLYETSPFLIPHLFKPIIYQNYFGNEIQSSTNKLPLVSVSDGEVFFVVKPGYVQRLLSLGIDPFVDDLQRQAFLAFTALAERSDLSLAWDVECGDLEIYDNFRILHAREAYEGAGRCLFRIWVSDPLGKPLPPIFKDAPDYNFTYTNRVNT